LTFGKPKTIMSDLFKDMNLKTSSKDSMIKTKVRTTKAKHNVPAFPQEKYE